MPDYKLIEAKNKEKEAAQASVKQKAEALIEKYKMGDSLKFDEDAARISIPGDRVDRRSSVLSQDDFKKRANRLFEDNRTRYRKVLAKNLKKAKLPISALPPADKVLPFTRAQFAKWLWDQVGLQVALCPHCRAPIDILTLELDHKTPLRRGGEPELDNLEPICRRCNSIKGELTREEYVIFVNFLEGPATAFRARLEGIMISGGVGKMMRHFPKAAKKAKSAPVVEFDEF
jgi:hypothetical protein